MKKTILVLLCCTMFVGAISCNKSKNKFWDNSNSANSDSQGVQNDSDNNTAQEGSLNSIDKNEDSIQMQQFQYFHENIDKNPYDQWLKNELAKGEHAEKDIYSEYLAYWSGELAFTIENGQELFNDKNLYGQWKNGIEEWLINSREILKVEMNMMNCSLGQLEVIIPYCEMVRQKVIDTKEFLYYYQVYNEFIDYTNIEISWGIPIE